MTSKHPEPKVENSVNSNAAEPHIEQKGQAEQTVATQPTENDNMKQSDTEKKAKEESLKPVDYVILGKQAFVFATIIIWGILYIIALLGGKKIPIGVFLIASLITATFDGIFRYAYYCYLSKSKQLTCSVDPKLTVQLLLRSPQVWKAAITTVIIFICSISLLILAAYCLGHFQSSADYLKNYENLIIGAIGGLSGSYVVDLIVHYFFHFFPQEAETGNKTKS
ncbi:hypothetical protein ACOR62_07655 [Neisseria lisongii]|uniref:Uncharacterized protein n=1 Tax=Neisseria lisongii TaxID=2912188 RepID=A0AAW5AGP1_9NEIS|nr:hypothetical protein [Neisseria lisongii]MCF7530250.1 hypothetical protein [Neisseria lisongii]